MIVECLKGFLGLVAVTLQKEEQTLFVEIGLIVLDIVLSDVLVEFLDLFTFIFVMLDLSEIEETSALLALLSLLFFLCVNQQLLFGKKR